MRRPWPLLSLLLGVLLLASPAWALLETDSDIVPLQTAAGSAINGNTLPVAGFNTVGVELTVSATATVTWEGSAFATFVAISCTNKTSGASATTATTTGTYVCDVAGLQSFRARISSFGSGTITANARATTASLGAGSAAAGGGDASAANQATEITSLQLIDDDQTGGTMFHRISVGTTEDEHEVKATAGRLFSIVVTNTNAAARYLRCAQLTAANTTPGSSTVWFGTAIPGQTTGAGFTVSFGPAGAAFTPALTCWFVTGAAETDVAEVAANEINANYVIK